MMSESEQSIAATYPEALRASSFAVADEHGGFAEGDCGLICESPGTYLLLIEQADGWRAGPVAALPDAEFRRPPLASDWPAASCADAVVAACETLIAWCGEEKQRGSKKHKKHAEKLQDWALALVKREATVQKESLGTASAEAAVEVASSASPLPTSEGASEAPDQQEQNAATVSQDASLHTSAIPDGELRLVAIEDLHESQWNPRQYYPEAKMAELVESMRASGYRDWLPLMVRPREQGGYEIAAGHRRRRAAELAGIRMIPCVVRPLTDEQFLDVLNFDNGGRDDVHPLHEAAGWRAWMEKTGKGVLDIANRIGQSKEYVYQRLKYGALIPDAVKAFLDGKVTAAHAILVARLDAKGQQRALTACEPPSWEPDKLFSVRALQSWIKRNLHCSLDDAEFSLSNAELLPAAGPCVVCPHRLGNTPDFNAFEDLPDVCTRPDCYAEKESAWYARRVPQISTEAPPLAPVHAPAPAPKRVKPSKEDTAAEAERLRVANEERARECEREERECNERNAKLDAEKATRLRILRAILAKVKWPPRREEVEYLLGDIELPDEMSDVLVEQGLDSIEGGFTKLDKLSDQRIAALLVLVYVGNDFDTWTFGHGAETLEETAKRYGVDARKIRAGTRKEVVKKLPVLGAPKKAKKLPAETVKKIADAQKARWAQHKKQQAAKEQPPAKAKAKKK